MKQKINGKNLLRAGLSFVFVMILSTSLFLAAAGASAQKSMSYDNVLSVLEKIEYTDMLRDDVKKVYGHLGYSSGIPEEITEAFLTRDVTDEDLLLPLHQIFTEETLTLDTKGLKDAFCDRVSAYADELYESGKMDVSEETFEEMKKSFPETADYYVDELASSIRLSGTYSVLGSAILFILRLSPLLFYASLALFLFALILLVLIQKKQVFAWLYAGFGAASFVLCAPALWYRGTKFVLRLAVEPLYFKTFLHGMAASFFDCFAVWGMIFLGAGALCFVLYLVISKAKGKKSVPEKGKTEENTAEERKETTV